MGILICAMCITAMMSATAFAATGDTSRLQNDQQTRLQQNESGAYMQTEGTVSAVTDEGEYYRVEVENTDMGMIFITKKDLLVVDQKTGKNLEVKDLEKGMDITAIIAKDSPMTMSIPPQTPGAVSFAVKEEGGTAVVGVFNEELVNEANTLKLNLAETTRIVDLNGKELAADTVKGSECLVLYTVSTRSIPAQTTPQAVVVLNEAQDTDQEEAPQDTEGSETAPAYVELRSAAEAKGYKVEWTSAKAPISLTKDGSKVEVTIGSDAFTFTHATKDIKPLDRMEKMDLPVKLENGKTLVSNSFIDALE